VSRLSISLALLVASSLLAADQTDPRFEKWLDQSRKIFASHHLIAYVRLAHIDRKGPPFEFRYDRYPEGIERVQRPDGAALARKKGKNWLVSDESIDMPRLRRLIAVHRLRARPRFRSTKIYRRDFRCSRHESVDGERKSDLFLVSSR
jgi:hypothetical protein